MAFPELVELRKKLLLPQERVAQILGIMNALTISHWETGFRVPSEPIRRLIRTLNSIPKAEAEHFLYKMEKMDQKNGAKK